MYTSRDGEVSYLENAERLRVEVEDADALLRDDGADGLERGAVVGLLVLAVLDELAREDVLLELQPRDEVVVLTVHLVGAPRPGRVWGRDREGNARLVEWRVQG